jgi:hypothetical protein
MATEKMKSFLRKFITEETMNSITTYEGTSNLIGFIVTTNKDFRPIFDIRQNLHYVRSTDIVCHVRDYINEHTEEYPGPNDEHYSFEEAFMIPESNNIYYRFKQSWYKGMSNSATIKYLTVDSNYKVVDYVIEYEELARLGIYTLGEFFRYLQRNKFQGYEYR